MEARLTQAVRLREAGKSQEARVELLKLIAEYPDDARLNYQTAWCHDVLGLEREAVPYYERALALGLEDDRAGALLGLGSTYRTLGEYRQAVETLREGVEAYPEQRAIEVFLAMALYNVGEHAEAVERLLRLLAATSEDSTIQEYRRAIEFYAVRLDEVE